MSMNLLQKIKRNQKIIHDDSPVIMGILNVTPDSFSDGGKFNHVDKAVERALEMQQQGAHIIDIGGESTRPGAESVNALDEIDRVVPVIERLSQMSDVFISIDTSKAVVMEVAIQAGASMVNDVNALQDAGAVEICKKFGVTVCLMHMKGLPRIMQEDPRYDDVVAEVSDFLKQRAQHCIDKGIAKDSIVIDPGFGFGKKLEHNLSLLKHYDALCSLNFPVMMGVSRKSMLGLITGGDVDDRLIPGIAAVVAGYQKGGRIFRVHDVKETKDALLLCEAVDSVK